ncbi:rod shape-determining protein MreC [Erysipelothrix inopinata]|uniref:Cell shape-determining protein MreC n=1 Tax=Erysipelothrix inopinata TaxID=225084 RepID=A0A7G9RY09_9FIRM|nr:rod shape-determining protein MreC [Erysipelothrix inopinata]QNN60484.1 rod shape-determining protein MreC [Erysipelothrix inopinata]
MKRKNVFKRVVLFFIAFSVVSLIGMGFIKNNAYYQSADRSFFSFVSMIRYGIFDKPIKTVGNVSNDVATMWDVRYENDQLRSQLDAVNHWQAQLNELQHEVNELKELNNLKTIHSEYTLINATVMNRSSETWDSAVTIDRGSDDGIEVGDGVVTPKGIVGRVIKVDAKTSVVSLIVANDDYSQMSVKIQEPSGSFVQGILKSYNKDTNLFTISLLQTNISITPDMVISTSGLGGVYPAGLFVGNVDSVKEVADGAGITVYAKSLVDFNALNYVSVVKKP